MKNKAMDETMLDEVSGGATVVEINPGEANTIRCFFCKSLDVRVEKNGAMMTVTCNHCGAVDIRKA